MPTCCFAFMLMFCAPLQTKRPVRYCSVATTHLHKAAGSTWLSSLPKTRMPCLLTQISILGYRHQAQAPAQARARARRVQASVLRTRRGTRSALLLPLLVGLCTVLCRFRLEGRPRRRKKEKKKKRPLCNPRKAAAFFASSSSLTSNIKHYTLKFIGCSQKNPYHFGYL